MPSRIEQAKPLIEDVVENFIDDVQAYASNHSVEIPTSSIYQSNTFSGRQYEYPVDRPSLIVRHNKSFKRFYFSDLVDELLRNDLSFCPHRRGGIERSIHMKRIFNLAKLTMDYAGDLQFDQDAFDFAYADHIAPLYMSTHQHRIVFPLARVILRPENINDPFKVELPPMKQSLDRREYLVEILNDLSISRLSDDEMTAMQTYGVPGMITQPDQTQKRLGWASALEVECEVTHRPIKHNPEHVGLDQSWTGHQMLWTASEIAKQVVTTIRLWDPENYAGFGPGYLLRDSWKTYRDISADVANIIIPQFRQRGKAFTKDAVEIQETEIDEFRSFWEESGPYCSFESGRDHTLRNSLKRFNRMYERASPEDRIIDAYIGFETTLIRGDPASVLPERAEILLEEHGTYNGEQIRAFMENLRHIRNEIVHNDASITEERLGDASDAESPREYSPEVRRYLAEVIIAYTHLLGSPGESIQKVNVDILDNQIDDQSAIKSLLSRLNRCLPDLKLFESREV